MKRTAIVAFTLAIISPMFADTNPCERTMSNAERRECYAREKARVNQELDSLVADLTAEFNRDAANFAKEANSTVAECMKKAASKLNQSQKTWKAYREQHCEAIVEYYTTGSGAGTAYEECEYRLAEERMKELKTSFRHEKSR